METYAKSWSLSACNLLPGFAFKYKKQLQLLFKYYVVRRKALFAELKKEGIIKELPAKTPNSTGLLEHLYTLIPDEHPKAEKLRNKIKNLIKTREKVAAYLIPVYRATAKNVARRMKVGYEILEDYRVEEAIYEAASRSLDRMSEDKIGIRSDFIVCLIRRAIIKALKENQKLVQIEYGRESEEGILEHRLVYSESM